MDYEIFELGDLKLQSGQTVPNAVLAYKTHGTLAPDKRNVVVVPTWYPGQHTDLEWLFGEDKALDPRKYFIVVPDMLANGLSSSPSNTAPPFDRSRFPTVTIYDNIRAQHRLLTEQFGVERIALVTGISMGALQTYQWAASYPEMVERIAPICGTARCWPHNYVALEGVKAAIRADAAWNDGDYAEQPIRGLRAAGRVYAGWVFSAAFHRERRYQDLGFPTLEEFLSGFWDGFFPRRDANNCLAMATTWQLADISTNPEYDGNFERALAAITARAIVMPGQTDLMFPVELCEYEVQHIPNADLRPIDSVWGHAAGVGFNPMDTQFIDDNLRELLAR